MPRTSFRVNAHSIVCLNVKELLARSRRHISTLTDSNGTRTHNHLVHKRTLNHLANLATLECGFTLKLVRDMIITYSQMHRTDKFSQHSSIIWPNWLNGPVFLYELSGCGFESRCCIRFNNYFLNMMMKFNFPSKYIARAFCINTAQKIKFSIKDFFSKCY